MSTQVTFDTPGTYRWTCPDKVTLIDMEAKGGDSGDGNPGETVRQTLKVTSGATYEVTVAEGGYTLARVIRAGGCSLDAPGVRAAPGRVILTYDED